MQIRHAVMEVVDVDDRLVADTPRTKFKGKREIDLTVVHHDRRTGQSAKIRVYTVDAALAEEMGHETGDHHVLTDWFEVHDVTVSFYDGRLTLIGYQQGVEGSRRDGKNPVGPGDGHPMDDEGRPLVRVRWDLW